MKKLLGLTCAAVLTLSLVACGGSSSDLSKIEQIKEEGKLVMMTATGFPPYEYLGEDGQPAGIDIDLAALVAAELGVEYEVLDMDFGLLVESLKAGKGDMIAAAMSVTEERMEQIDFTMTYAKAGQVILLPVGSEITSFEDILDKSIAVQESTTSHIYVEEELGLSTLAFKNAVLCAEALLTGKVDCVVIDDTAAKLLVSSYGADKLMYLEELVTEEDYAMGIAKGDDEFVALVNAVIEKAIADGTLDEIIIKHAAATQE